MPDPISAAVPQRPVLLFYCQHSLGIGHLTRSFALAAAMEAPLPRGLPQRRPAAAGPAVPPGIELVDLPPLAWTTATPS